MTYEVGKFYNVPCIKTTRDAAWCGEWMPVIGPLHSDAEIIKFPASHWHIDWRFVLSSAMRHVRTETPYGNVVQRIAYEHHPDDFSIYKQPLIEGDVVVRRMKCKRDWPPYPHAKQQRHWGPELEKAFAGCKLGPGMVCPHRGVPLDGAQRDGDVVTCPGHGLRWNIKTGELVLSPPQGERS